MNNRTPAVSVIIPVYNVEKYLRRCLDSVINQTFTDFELILVNDGSTDNSLKICREYSIADSRIKVIDIPNGGCSKARKTGLENSSGEWILHVDSDDWIELDMLQSLYAAAIGDDADIVACGLCFDDGLGTVSDMNFPYKSEKGTDIYRINVLYSSLCNKLIRRNLYEKNNISPVPGVSMWEDVIVTTRLRFHSRKTVIVPRVLYHYFSAQRGSLCNVSARQYPYDQIKVVKYLCDYFSDKDISKTILHKLTDSLKLAAKSDIFDTDSEGAFNLWKSLYSESNASIWSMKHIRIKTRILWYIASKTDYKRYNKIINRLRQIWRIIR